MCFLNYIEDDDFDEDDCGEDDNDHDVDEGDGDYKVGDSNGVRDDDVDEGDGGYKVGDSNGVRDDDVDEGYGGYKVGDSNGVRGDDVGLQCKHMSSSVLFRLSSYSIYQKSVRLDIPIANVTDLYPPADIDHLQHDSTLQTVADLSENDIVYLQLNDGCHRSVNTKGHVHAMGMFEMR